MYKLVTVIIQIFILTFGNIEFQVLVFVRSNNNGIYFQTSIKTLDFVPVKHKLSRSARCFFCEDEIS